MIKLPPERSCSISDSISLAKKELERLGISYQLSFWGNNNVKTYQCKLYKDNKLVAIGNGKGRSAQSEASALFESLEHYYTETESDVESKIINVPTSYFQSVDKLIEDKPIELLVEMNKEDVSCLKYVSLDNHKEIFYPVFLTKPNQDTFLISQSDSHSGLRKYSTNSGTAIGTCLEESLIHAVNEIIERDAFSIFLLKTYFNRNKPSIEMVRLESVCATHKKLVNQIECITGSSIVILNLTSDLEIPVFGVALISDKYPIQILGFGASLSTDYALERALLETLQLFHLYDEELIREDNLILESLRRSKKYYECARCDISLLLKENRFFFKDFSKSDYPHNLNDYLLALRKKLKNLGFDFYYRLLSPQESQIVCVQAIIPGLEKFNVVRSACTVLPSKRGMTFI